MLSEWLHCSYNAGMPVAITIRNVPEGVRDELAARAARSGRSLQEYLAGLLTDLTTRPLVEDAGQRRRIGAESRAYVEQIHDADRIADRLLDIYSRLQ